MSAEAAPVVAESWAIPGKALGTSVVMLVVLLAPVVLAGAVVGVTRRWQSR